MRKWRRSVPIVIIIRKLKRLVYTKGDFLTKTSSSDGEDQFPMMKGLSC